ncbi:MurR/RpiR family transcriptional regulator [Lactiplantibacillus paraplantarum]|uniref:MurR/RpiR family transcriptional regulator n=3 Tax=Lactiplantibacillus paraplantarum TaxID=60520 RepID=UPI000512DC48|nr:MurR/RpiR family transcriptional regulator [Lactiplantibacillus paraplantarum]ALO04850.1 RpiR family transcriptional regulator [Lactiplantibacillus paraplantarum]KGE74259.1 RpiR family transcriptional regulator [Lactiplantibacillus paraplantarum]MCT4457365.1 MurR/RpiR family transcriptional regulator [Lactiplantibacillus paraplantarum]MCW1910955.1 MurR/RpiR family transcriptional regulator [Lactiplantibacillus paraplantarum]
MQLIEQLSHRSDFTTTETRIATYILNHQDKIATTLIKELAAKTYTSHSAIIRLAQKLGFHGFRDFQRALITEIAINNQKATTVDANFPFTDQDSVATIAKKMADLKATAIANAHHQLNTVVLTNCAQLLNTAHHIMLFSQGDSQLRARSFQNKLIKINRFAQIAEAYADEAWNVASLTSQDCAMFISYAGTTDVHQRFAKYCHDHNIPVIVLSGNVNSPLQQFATYNLIITQNEQNTTKLGTFASQASFEYILDTLFATMYAYNFESNLTHLRTTQRLIQNGPLQTK